MNEKPTGLCEVCKKDSDKMCADCKSVYYCCAEHQRQHWREHKKTCRPYKVETNAVFGRYLIATRDIGEREIVLCEKPLVFGPKIAPIPTCLSCYRNVKPDPITNEFFHCPSCGWPMCDQQCSVDPAHQEECKLINECVGNRPEIYYKNPPKKEPAYSYIVPLRCLLLQKNNLRKYETLLQLQSHHEERQSTPLYRIYKDYVTPYLNDKLKMRVDSETVLRINGILDTNAFEIRRMGIKIRGIYPNAAMLAHDCRPNTRHAFFGENNELIVRATVPIRKGERITATYTQTLWGTMARRQHLREVKCFDCTCARCADRSEFGMYVGAIFCPKCEANGGGQKMVSVEPLNYQAVWKCEKCTQTMTVRQVTRLNENAREELNKLKKLPENFEEFIQKYDKVFHPTSSVILDVKYALFQLYTSSKNSVLSDERLGKLIDVGSELLRVADCLEGGSSRFRGTILHELQLAIISQTKRKYKEQKITLQETVNIIDKCLVQLSEARGILKLEPEMIDILPIELEKLSVLDDPNSV